MNTNWFNDLFIEEAKAIKEARENMGGSDPVVEELNVTENGVYTPPEGVDGYSPVNVEIPIKEPVLEELQITANGMYTPPAGVDGYSKIEVTTPVSDGEVRSLKKLLDATKSTYYFFYNSTIETLDGIFEYGDTSKVTTMQNMFNGCTNITTIPMFDTSSVTNMSGMLGYCSKITTVPTFDTSSVKNMGSMFWTCEALTTIPELNTSSVTNMSSMLGYCRKLTTVPTFDTSSVTDMSGMFSGCSNLTTIPLLDTSKVTTMQNMFSNCIKLTSVPMLDTSSVTHIGSMFRECKKLTYVPELDIRNVTSASSMFYYCTVLTEIWIRNIKTNLTVSTGSTTDPILKVESLVHLCNELRNVNAARTLTMGPTNLAKLANVYVKLVDITDEMRAEDDLIDEKLPCVVCESTDEGAMLISDYVALKQWTLA